VRTLLRFATRIVGVLALALLAAAAAGLGYRAWVHSGVERALAIRSPQGIDEASFVKIGGSEQWLSIRGQDRASPVLLIVHGGPGNATSAVAQQLLPYERDYVVVHWDQPGAGKTFARAGSRFDPALTIDGIAQDGIAVAEHLQARLGHPPTILLGVSWGSVVGIRMARARPDLFAAYVGTGQIVSIQRGEELAYRRVLEEARRRDDSQAVAELEAIGPPPYASPLELGTQRRWASRFEGLGDPRIRLLRTTLLAPRYSLADGIAYARGVLASQNYFFGERMDGPLVQVDLAVEPTRFDLPVVIIQGEDDSFTPASLARDYLAALTAPHKEFVPVSGAGHFALGTHPDAFLAALKERVRPLISAR
jgi:pimeloyl-ACP methyl ester carboxylesterase